MSEIVERLQATELAVAEEFVLMKTLEINLQKHNNWTSRGKNLIIYFVNSFSWGKNKGSDLLLI